MKRLLLALCLLTGPAFAEGPLLVFAAASLAGPLDAVVAASRDRVVISYAGSGTLARQLEAGAPADVVILANTDWMDHLVRTGTVRPDTVQPALGNVLVLAAPAEGGQPPIASQTVPIDFARAITALPPGTRIATGFTESVPVGIYARQALEAAGVWDGVAGQLVQVENARLALALLARGEVGHALVYRSDVVAEPRVRVEAEIPAGLHSPITYVVGRTRASAHPEAAPFLQALSGPAAQAIFAEAGFAPPPGAPQ